MSVHWGFYCKDCEAESRRWFTDPRKLRDIYQKATQTFEDVWCDRPLELPTTEIEPLFFLAQHYKHELWIQCELAQLQLSKVAPTEQAGGGEDGGEDGSEGRVDLPPPGRALEDPGSGIHHTPG